MYGNYGLPSYDPTAVMNYFTKAVDTTYLCVGQLGVSLASKSYKFGGSPRFVIVPKDRTIPSQALQEDGVETKGKNLSN